MGTESEPITLDGILQRLARSQVKTQRQVDTLSETLLTLITKLDKNAACDDMMQTGLQKVKRSVPSGMDTVITSDLSMEEEVETPNSNQGIKRIHEGFFKELGVFAENGDWEGAKLLFKHQPEALSWVVTEDSQTALHFAVNAGQWKFAEELLKIVPPKMLEAQETKHGYTALHTVVVEANVELAKAMVKINPKLTQIREYNGSVPLQVAADYVTDRQEEMVRYLLSVTRDEEPSPFSGPHGASLLCSLVDANFYDIALSLVQEYPNLVTQRSKNSKDTALEMIARKPFAFLSGCMLTSWQRWIYSVIPVDLRPAPACKHMKGYVENSLLSSSEDSLNRDVENPRLSSEDSLVDSDVSLFSTPEDSAHTRKLIGGWKGGSLISSQDSSSNRGAFRSTFQNFLTRVPAAKTVHKKKLMHKQVTALVKCMLTQLNGTASQLEFLEKSNVLKTAMKSGTTEFVVECLESFPELIWRQRSILQVAIEERNDKVLNLICKLSADHKDDLVSRRDGKGNSILHYVAKLAPSHQLKLVSGTPLQMQREMQWFKGVENLLPEKYRLARNKDGNTAQHIFTEEHVDLAEKAENWMKGTSESCMLVTTLITTVTFAAAFTVPGGNTSDSKSENNGTPIFLFNNAFMVFAVADALALFSSITSVLMFLSILTSRYAEVDFLVSLPRKLILGLATLFFSLATLMIAFGAALAIVLGSRLPWVPIPVSLFACVPVSLFGFLQFPLFIEMVRSTYWPSIFTSNKHKQRSVKHNDKKNNKKEK